jgi:E1A/CREB-binding protein
LNICVHWTFKIIFFSYVFLQDIFKQATEDCLTGANEMPYFEGDFWPNVLEESIKELEQEAEERKKEENVACSDTPEVGGETSHRVDR